MTPTKRAALQWFYAHGMVGWFDRTAPSQAMRNKLEREGLIEVVPCNQTVHVVRYRLSAAGRAVLSA
ncbi:MAG TPA: hypothetical protein DEQ40_00415 [Oxalobacteraceae bacterium]|jgi:hypothetical protein|nr:hypothetical protein [Oxalobacteraceae bacterium]